MSDTIGAMALGVAVIATIVGLLFFHPSELWAALTRKTHDRWQSLDPPVGGDPHSGGGAIDGGSGGGDGAA